MSNHTYNLDESVNEGFEFILGGHTYKMRYPTTEEIQKGQEFKDNSPEQMDWLYSFISCDDKDAPLIKDAMKKVNVIKLQKFATMLKTEFTGEE
jgi:hypothetical protein